MTTNHNELHDQYKRGLLTHDELLRLQSEAYPRCKAHNRPAPGVDDLGRDVCDECMKEQDHEDRLRTKSHGLITGGYPI